MSSGAPVCRLSCGTKGPSCLGSELGVQGEASGEDSEDWAAAGPHVVHLQGPRLSSWCGWQPSALWCLSGTASVGAVEGVQQKHCPQCWEDSKSVELDLRCYLLRFTFVLTVPVPVLTDV